MCVTDRPFKFRAKLRHSSKNGRLRWRHGDILFREFVASHEGEDYNCLIRLRRAALRGAIEVHWLRITASREIKIVSEG